MNEKFWNSTTTHKSNMIWYVWNVEVRSWSVCFYNFFFCRVVCFRFDSYLYFFFSSEFIIICHSLQLHVFSIYLDLKWINNETSEHYSHTTRLSFHHIWNLNSSFFFGFCFSLCHDWQTWKVVSLLRNWNRLHSIRRFVDSKLQ